MQQFKCSGGFRKQCRSAEIVSTKEGHCELGSAYPGGMQSRHLPDEVKGFGRGSEGQAAKTGLEQGHSHAPCIRLHTASAVNNVIFYCSLLAPKKRHSKPQRKLFHSCRLYQTSFSVAQPSCHLRS